MDNERRKKLEETMKKFNKDQKSEVFSLGSEIKELPVIPSGIKRIDDFLGGGFKCGGHTIIWSPSASVGKTALMLKTIATAQKLGKFVCYVNTEKPIEPERFRFFDVNLDDMIYIEAPEDAEKALEALRTLCKNKVIDLFVIDSTNGLCPKCVQTELKTGKDRSLVKKNVATLPLVLSSFYNIVSAHIFRSKAAIIWVGQGRTQGIGSFFTRVGLSGGKAQEFYAYQIISLRKGDRDDNPKKPVKRYLLDKDNKLRYKTEKVDIGFGVVMKMQKTNSCKSVKENGILNVPFVHAKGFVDVVEETKGEIEISGTEEQKEIIAKMLVDKEFKKLTKDDKKPIHSAKDVAKETLNDTINVIQGNAKITELKITSKETLKEPKKRGRGRPKKEKK